MPNFVNVTIEEFRALLKEEKGWRETDPNAHEYVFEFPLENTFKGTVVKVFTTVNKRNDNGRGKGSDSIKVCAVHLPTGKGIVATTRVFRTPNWQDRVVNAVIDSIEKAKKRKWMVFGIHAR